MRYDIASRFAMSARPRPISRFTEVIVLAGSLRARRQRIEADLAAVVVEVAHGRRQQHAALVVGQAFGHAVAHRRHQRMGGAEVDAHGNATLMRIGRLAGFEI